MKYPKINSIWKRDEKGQVIEGEYSLPEFEFLKDCEWTWTEKVDGTNIRLSWDTEGFDGNEHEFIAGRSDSSQIPPHLLAVLLGISKSVPWADVFDGPVVLYGEGYGAKIQKGGGNYLADGCAFVLFDVKVGDWWLRRGDVEDVAGRLGLDVVPVVAVTTVGQAMGLVRAGFDSRWGPDVSPEGLVGRPSVDLYDRQGSRITMKLKARDLTGP